MKTARGTVSAAVPRIDSLQRMRRTPLSSRHNHDGVAGCGSACTGASPSTPAAGCAGISGCAGVAGCAGIPGRAGASGRAGTSGCAGAPSCPVYRLRRCAPVYPVAPVPPVAPVSPVAPVLPVAPCGPAGPAGNVKHPPNASVSAPATNSFEYLMMIPFIWLTKTAHVIVRSHPDVISFWRQLSAPADQAIATARSHPKPTRTETPGLHPVGGLRLPVRLRDPLGRVSTAARIAGLFRPLSSCGRGVFMIAGGLLNS